MDALEKLGYKKCKDDMKWENNQDEYIVIWKYDDLDQWCKGNYFHGLDFTSDEILAIAEVIRPSYVPISLFDEDGFPVGVDVCRQCDTHVYRSIDGLIRDIFCKHCGVKLDWSKIDELFVKEEKSNVENK